MSGYRWSQRWHHQSRSRPNCRPVHYRHHDRRALEDAARPDGENEAGPAGTGEALGLLYNPVSQLEILLISQDENRFSQFKERKARATKAYYRTLQEPETAARHRNAENELVLAQTDERFFFSSTLSKNSFWSSERLRVYSSVVPLLPSTR